MLVGVVMQMRRSRVDIELLITCDYEWLTEPATTIKESVKAAGLSAEYDFLATWARSEISFD